MLAFWRLFVSSHPFLLWPLLDYSLVVSGPGVGFCLFPGYLMLDTGSLMFDAVFIDDVMSLYFFSS